MTDYRDRVRKEKIELDDKLRKLNMFIKSEAFTEVSDEQKTLLHMQSNAMVHYSGVLRRCIVGFVMPVD